MPSKKVTELIEIQGDASSAHGALKQTADDMSAVVRRDYDTDHSGNAVAIEITRLAGHVRLH